MKIIEMVAVPEFPIIKIGDDIAEIIINNIQKSDIELRDDDIIVIAQKIISIAENCIVDLDSIAVTEEAKKLASSTGRTIEECQLYINESSEILEVIGKNVVVRHRLGYVCTSAGIDKSNIGNESGKVCLLPKNPDLSANRIRTHIFNRLHIKVAVIISDTMGRAYRHGSIAEAIGIAGISPIESKVERDLFGRKTSPKIGLVDRIASGASLLMGEACEQCPVIIVKNVNFTRDENANIVEILK